MKNALASVCAVTCLLAQTDPPHIKSAFAAYQAGKAAVLDRHFQDAIQQFQKAIEIEPTFLSAFDSLIAAYIGSGNRAAAASTVTQLLEIEPELTRYRLLLGRILMEEDQPRRALAQFSFVLKNEEFNPDALLGFAAAAHKLGMEDRAAEALARGNKQYPSDSRFKPVQKP